MSRFSFLVKRLVKMDYKRMRSVFAVLRKRSGKSRLGLSMDLLLCAARYNAGYMDYMIAQMYQLSPAQRRTVLTRGINNTIVKKMNDKAYWHKFDDKTEFNRVFAKWIQRDWLYCDENLSPHALHTFIAGKDAVFVKPLKGSSGQGIAKYTKNDWDNFDAFEIKTRGAGPSIIEEGIVQHEIMSSLNPGSVNTVRIATLLGDRQEGIVYAFLRVGNGKIMDNVDCGGMAARVDLTSGKLLTVAADKAGSTFTRHPLTGTEIIGFQLPFFDEAKSMCMEAMKLVPQMKYVAWDVALTQQGPVFIEGNSFPSHAVPQFAAHYPDGIGILPEFQKFITI